MAKMKDQAIVCNIGHFDNEIQVAALRRAQVGQHQAAGRQSIFPDGKHHPIMLAEGPPGEPRLRHRPPELRDVNSFTNQTLAQIELFNEHGNYESGVYTLPKQLDEKVARLHLEKLGVKLTELTDEQAAYIGLRRSCMKAPHS
jgi:adenosylhomocysteinase